MYYIIQDNVFKEENDYKLIEVLERFELPYERVNLDHGVNNFEFKTKRKDVFPFGAVKLARISKDYQWYPGSQMSDNHNYQVYSKYYKENLLNYDSEIVKLADHLTRKQPFFARPTLDTKIFTGKVFTIEEWNKFKEEQLANPRSNLINKDTEIQISSVKKIQKEIRFWIVKGQPVTASLYTLGGVYHIDGPVDEDAYNFVRDMIKLFELNETFVMDICLIDDKYKIVECGCTNSAGFYKCDMQKLIMALENAFGG